MTASRFRKHEHKNNKKLQVTHSRFKHSMQKDITCLLEHLKLKQNKSV